MNEAGQAMIARLRYAHRIATMGYGLPQIHANATSGKMIGVMAELVAVFLCFRNQMVTPR